MAMLDFGAVKRITSFLTTVVLIFSLIAGLPDRQLPDENINSPLVTDARFYVSTAGSDANDGTIDAPFATIEKARNAVYALKTGEGLPEGGLTVAIMAGEYSAPNGLGFTAENSGTAACPVTYCAYGDGEVIINGGLTLKAKDFVPVGGAAKKRLSCAASQKVLQCDLGALGVTAEDYGKLYAFGSYNTAAKYDGDTVGPIYSELFWNGERMTLARYPNGNDFLKTGKIYDNGDTQETYGNGTVQNPGWPTMRNPRGGTFGISCALRSRIKGWATLDDVWLFGYFKYDWADSTTPIASVDMKKRTLTTKYASVYGFNEGARYYIFNSLEELDAKGEWYLDRNSGILYLYPPGPVETADIQISLTTDNILHCQADYLTFRGLTVKGTRSNGIVAIGSHNRVEDCRVTGVAGSGIILRGNENLAAGNEVFHIGASGIDLSGGDRVTLTPCNSVARDNLVHHWSEVVKTYRSAIGANGVGITIAHNEMHTAPHLAVLYGGNDIVIEYNKIHHVCSETIDGGAVYAGRNWTMQGCAVRYNYFYDINADIGNPVALYFDDALSGQTAFGNVFKNIKGIGILAGGGRDLVLSNNIFIDVGTPVSYDDRARDGYVNNGWFAHMVVPSDGYLWSMLAEMPYTGETWSAKYPSLAKISTDRSKPDDIEFACNPSHSVVENNLLYKSGKKLGSIADSVYRYSTIGDNAFYPCKNPGFADACGGDYSLRPDADVFRRLPGFQNVPFHDIGISG